MRDNTDKQLDCRGDRSGGRDARFREVREQSMAAAPTLSVDSGANGGIQVKGWSKPGRTTAGSTSGCRTTTTRSLKPGPPTELLRFTTTNGGVQIGKPGAPTPGRRQKTV
jgi:hypothetical protein